jgi:hypothetical protein
MKSLLSLPVAIGGALSLLSFSSPSVRAQTPVTVTNVQPKIQFEAILHDFGRVANGAVVKHDYIFTNTGTAPLTIQHVQVSCGCTATADWSREVAPGATGKIPIQFNSANFGGTVFKTVTVSCNDPAQPNVTLQFKANIWKALEISPAFAVVNAIADSSMPAGTAVRIVSNLEEPLLIKAVESNSKLFLADVVTNTPGKEYSLNIKLNPPLAAGNVQGQITLRTSATNHAAINIPVLAVVQPAIVISPAQITLPADPSPQPQSFVIMVRNQTSTPFTMSDAASNAGNVAVGLKQIEAGRQYHLEVAIPADYNIPPGQTLEITARTSYPDQPVIKIPINQVPKLRPPGTP